MPDQLQLRGGTTTEHNSFTGAAREVTVDTTKKTLVVHDGSQAGGTPLMKESGATAASSVTLGTGGVERLKLGSSEVVFNETGANTDFRIESDTKTHMFFLDAGNNRIGINTASPSSVFSIQDTATAGDGITEALRLVSSSNTNNDGTRLSFARSGLGVTAAIDAKKVETAANETEIIFSSMTASSLTEKARINGQGRLLIGTTTEGSGSADDLTIATSGNTGMTIRSGTSNEGNIFFSDGTSGTDEYKGYLQYTHTDNSLIFGTDSVGRMRIDSSGNVGIGMTPSGMRLDVQSTANDIARFSGPNAGGLTIRNDTSNEIQIHTAPNDALIFGTNGENERMRIDSSGRFLLNMSSSVTGGKFQVNNQFNTFFAATNDSTGCVLQLQKTRSTSPDGYTILQDGDKLGDLQFKGATGSSAVIGANIQAIVNGTVGSGNDLPTDLTFRVMPDGIGSTLERMRIQSNGVVLMGKTSTSQTATLQVQADSNADAIVIYGRSADDIAEISWYENDGTTKLGELQYRQDHIAMRHRVGHIEFATTYSGDSVGERMRLFEDKLLIGTTAGAGLGASRRLQVRGNLHSNNGINILSTHNDDNPAVIDIGKSRSSGNAILGNNDDVGQINFYGNDGNGFHSMARILCSCQGHDTGSDDLPSKLQFFTLKENSTTLRSRLLIDDEGIISMGSENHSLNVSTTASSGTSKYNFRGHHSGTVGSPGSGTLSFTVWSNGNVENLNNSYGQTSDETLKQDIVDASSQWDDIKGLRVRKFRFKDNPTGVLQIGVVAQEVEKVSAGLVYETGEEGEKVKAVKYSVLYMKAIKALQEAITKIEVLETKVAALEAA